MIKEKLITVTTTEKRKYCDDCGKEIRIDMACCRAYCEICGKDLCDKCVAAEDSTMGDYRTCYCGSCYDIKEKYQPKINDLEDEIERISELILTECKAKRDANSSRSNNNL